MKYIIINANVFLIMDKCRDVMEYINSLYDDKISHNSISRRLRNEGMIEFKELVIKSCEDNILQKYIIYNNNTNDIYFTDNIRDIEVKIKELIGSSLSYTTISRRLKEDNYMEYETILVKELV